MKPPPKEEAALAGGLGEQIPAGGAKSYSVPSIADVWGEVNPVRFAHINACLRFYGETGDPSWLGDARKIYLNAALASWPIWLAEWLAINVEDLPREPREKTDA